MLAYPRATSASTRKSAAERREEVATAVLSIIGRTGLLALAASNLAAEIGVVLRHFEICADIL